MLYVHEITGSYPQYASFASILPLLLGTGKQVLTRCENDRRTKEESKIIQLLLSLLEPVKTRK